MRHLSLLLALAVVGGLLISSQVLAADQYEYKSTNAPVVMAGEQLRQWHLAQDRVQQPLQVAEQGYFRTRLESQDQYQEQVHAAQLNSMQIREMQRLLNQRGYRIGTTDGGTIDQGTMAAIHRFQRDRGLAVTGMPNTETLDALSSSSGHDEFFGLAPEFGEPVD